LKLSCIKIPGVSVSGSQFKPTYITTSIIEKMRCFLDIPVQRNWVFKKQVDAFLQIPMHISLVFFTKKKLRCFSRNSFHIHVIYPHFCKFVMFSLEFEFDHISANLLCLALNLNLNLRSNLWYFVSSTLSNLDASLF